MVSTPSCPIEMKLPSGSCRRNCAGTASRPFSSTRTRWVPQNMRSGLAGGGPRGSSSAPPRDRGGEEKWLGGAVLVRVPCRVLRLQLLGRVGHHFSPHFTAIRHQQYALPAEVSTRRHKMWGRRRSSRRRQSPIWWATRQPPLDIGRR